MPLPQRIGRDESGASQRPGPECRRGALAAAQSGESGGGQRQQAIENRPVRRGHALHGERGGERPAHHDARRRQDHAGPFAGVRPPAARGREQRNGRHGRDERAAQADQQRGQLGHRDMRHGQGQRKHQHAEQAVAVALPDGSGGGREAGIDTGRRRGGTDHGSSVKGNGPARGACPPGPARLPRAGFAVTLRTVSDTVPIHFNGSLR